MTKQALTVALAGCASLKMGNSVVTVCLAARGNSAMKSNINRLQLSDDLAKSFLESAAATLSKLHGDLATGDKTLESYDPGNVPDTHEIEFHTPPAASAPAAVVRSLETLQQFPVFDGNAKTINSLVFHVIVIQRRGQQPVYLFRKYSKRKELGRSKKLVTLFSGGTFDKIKDPVFIFDDAVDCIAIAGHMVVLNKDNYHRIFDFFEEAIKHAGKTLSLIQSALPIENAGQFEIDCKGNALILVRLRGIAERNYFSTLTFAALEKKIKTDNLPIKISGNGKGKKLVYDSQQKWKFLRLLDDGFLNSDLTGKKYEATSKRSL